MDEKRTKGIYGKFRVNRTDGRDVPGEKHDGCEYFVLDLTHDPFALPAIMAYATACDEKYPLLARDLMTRAGYYGEVQKCNALHPPSTPARERERFDEFKNFHRLLCKRFGYHHDERDWKRDQLSLIEFIAAKCAPPLPTRRPVCSTGSSTTSAGFTTETAKSSSTSSSAAPGAAAAAAGSDSPADSGGVPSCEAAADAMWMTQAQVREVALTIRADRERLLVEVIRRLVYGGLCGSYSRTVEKIDKLREEAKR